MNLNDNVLNERVLSNPPNNFPHKGVGDQENRLTSAAMSKIDAVSAVSAVAA